MPPPFPWANDAAMTYGDVITSQPSGPPVPSPPPPKPPDVPTIGPPQVPPPEIITEDPHGGLPTRPNPSDPNLPWLPAVPPGTVLRPNTPIGPGGPNNPPFYPGGHIGEVSCEAWAQVIDPATGAP